MKDIKKMQIFIKFLPKKEDVYETWKKKKKKEDANCVTPNWELLAFWNGCSVDTLVADFTTIPLGCGGSDIIATIIRFSASQKGHGPESR